MRAKKSAKNGENEIGEMAKKIKYKCSYASCSLEYDTILGYKRHLAHYNHALFGITTQSIKCPFEGCTASKNLDLHYRAAHPGLELLLHNTHVYIEKLVRIHKYTPLLEDIRVRGSSMKNEHANVKEGDPKEEDPKEQFHLLPLENILSQQTFMGSVFAHFFPKGTVEIFDRTQPGVYFCRVLGCERCFKSIVAYKYHCRTYTHDVLSLFQRFCQIKSVSENYMCCKQIFEETFNITNNFILIGLTHHTSTTPDQFYGLRFSLAPTIDVFGKDRKLIHPTWLKTTSNLKLWPEDLDFAINTLESGGSELNREESGHNLKIEAQKYFLENINMENKLNGGDIRNNENYFRNVQLSNPKLVNHDNYVRQSNGQISNIHPTNGHISNDNLNNLYLFSNDDHNLLAKKNNFTRNIPERMYFPLHPNDGSPSNAPKYRFAEKHEIREVGKFLHGDSFRSANCPFDDEKFLNKSFLQPPTKQIKSCKPKGNNPKNYEVIRTSCLMNMKQKKAQQTNPGPKKDKYFTNSIKNLKTEDFVSVENLHHEITAAITNKDFGLSYVGLKKTISISPNNAGDMRECKDVEGIISSVHIDGGLKSGSKEENLCLENGLNRKGSLTFETSILKVYKERKQIDEIFFNYGTIRKIDLIQGNKNELAILFSDSKLRQVNVETMDVFEYETEGVFDFETFESTVIITDSRRLCKFVDKKLKCTTISADTPIISIVCVPKLKCDGTGVSLDIYFLNMNGKIVCCDENFRFSRTVYSYVGVTSMKKIGSSNLLLLSDTFEGATRAFNIDNTHFKSKNFEPKYVSCADMDKNIIFTGGYDGSVYLNLLSRSKVVSKSILQCYRGEKGYKLSFTPKIDSCDLNYDPMLKVVDLVVTKNDVIVFFANGYVLFISKEFIK